MQLDIADDASFSSAMGGIDEQEGHLNVLVNYARIVLVALNGPRKVLSEIILRTQSRGVPLELESRVT